MVMQDWIQMLGSDLQYMCECNWIRSAELYSLLPCKFRLFSSAFQEIKCFPYCQHLNDDKMHC